MDKKVFIVRPNFEYKELFTSYGWTLVKSLEEASLVLFTGGEDVSPSLYNETTHPRTGNNPVRDKSEQFIFNQAYEMGIPMVGICRGGQFLNVMNGGKMYQHVNNHAISGTHEALVPGIGTVKVTSTHHQMMRPNKDADHIVLMTANLSTQREYMRSDDPIIVAHSSHKPLGDDTEAVYYPDTCCLCFQPHPEFIRSNIGDTCTVFFFLLHNYLLSRLDMDVAKEFQMKESNMYDGVYDND